MSSVENVPVGLVDVLAVRPLSVASEDGGGARVTVTV